MKRRISCKNEKKTQSKTFGINSLSFYLRTKEICCFKWESMKEMLRVVNREIMKRNETGQKRNPEIIKKNFS